MRKWLEEPMSRPDYERLMRIVWLIVVLAVYGLEYLAFSLLQRMVVSPNWLRILIGVIGVVAVLWTSWNCIRVWQQRFWENKDA